MQTTTTTTSSAVEDVDCKEPDLSSLEREEGKEEEGNDDGDDDDRSSSKAAAAASRRRERRFLLKLDLCLITWAWLAYTIKVGGASPSLPFPFLPFLPSHSPHAVCSLTADI